MGLQWVRIYVEVYLWSKGGWEIQRSLSSKRGILISSMAQAHRRYSPFQAIPCATIGNHESRRLVKYVPE